MSNTADRVVNANERGVFQLITVIVFIFFSRRSIPIKMFFNLFEKMTAQVSKKKCRVRNKSFVKKQKLHESPLKTQILLVHI